jgi:biopolymer transport protein TolR
MSISFEPKNHKKRRIISDINITPFVDVLLVLLIIFMIAAPMMSSSVKLELPSGAINPIDSEVKSYVISIKADGIIFLQDNQIKLGNLVDELTKITNHNFDSKIQIRADKALEYGRVMDVIKKINLGGFSQVGLVTQNQE